MHGLQDELNTKMTACFARKKSPISSDSLPGSSTQSQVVNSPGSAQSGSRHFYQKSFVAGVIETPDNKKRHFIKIHGEIKEKNRALEEIARYVLNKAPYLHENSLLLSVHVNPDDQYAKDRTAFQSGLMKVLPGACLVTGAFVNRDWVPKVVTDYNNQQEFKQTKKRCAVFGIGSWDCISGNVNLEDCELQRGVFGFDSEGDLFVTDFSGKRWTFNPSVLAKQNNAAQADDLVLICSDLNQLEKLQDSRRWKSDMARTVGKIGVIREVKPDHDLLIKVSGEQQLYNPDSVFVIPRDDLTTLLKEHFTTFPHDSRYENNEFVQAVKSNNANTVVKTLCTALRDDMAETCTYKIQNINEDPLDDYHDLYIFADDSSLKSFGNKTLFRAQVEKAIASEMMKTTPDVSVIDEPFKRRKEKQIPIVNLVFNGNQETLETVTCALRNKIPTVVLKRSSAMDIIASLIDNNKTTSDHKGSDPKGKKPMQSKTFKECQQLLSQDQDLLFQECQRLLTAQPGLLLATDLSFMSTNIEDSLFRACLNAGCDTTLLFGWAIYHNVAGALTKLVRRKEYNNNVFRSHATFHAMLWSNVELFEMLIQTHIEPTVLITNFEYSQMCEKVDSDGLLHGLDLNQTKNKDISTVKQIIQEVKFVHGFVYNVSACWKSPGVASTKNPYWTYMFFWAILLREPEMAKLLYPKLENATAKASLTYKLCNSMKSLSKASDKTLEAEMTAGMIMWSKIATATIDTMHKQDAQKTTEVLFIKQPDLDNMTCVEMAEKSRHMEFIARPSCQEAFDGIWNGKITEQSSLKIAACFVFPFLAGILKTRDDEDKTKDKGGVICSDLLLRMNQFFCAPKTKFAYNMARTLSLTTDICMLTK